MAEEITFENAAFPTVRGSWRHLDLGSYCIPSCIIHRHLPTYQISLKSMKLFVDGQTDIWNRLYLVDSEESTYISYIVNKNIQVHIPNSRNVAYITLKYIQLTVASTICWNIPRSKNYKKYGRLLHCTCSLHFTVAVFCKANHYDNITKHKLKKCI